MKKRANKTICGNSDMSQEFAQSYFSKVSKFMNRVNLATIETIIKIFENAKIARKRIFFIGNGGSAATAMHFANDLIAIPTEEPRFNPVSLVDNSASITAIANDYGYEYVFVRQLEGRLKKGDILVGISASGNSENIIKHPPTSYA